ncbi:hypothetical protein F0562_014792 [Nyssa sinensis]|uniref:Growth-regulating factor n=1 Tax=Nyssa sinensis TaxID=561372 RepID=A0A5J4ZS04_9ASTE|nr:hypothetical protein F0562_014792 [Nyssa sinensis]
MVLWRGVVFISGRFAFKVVVFKRNSPHFLQTLSPIRNILAPLSFICFSRSIHIKMEPQTLGSVSLADSGKGGVGPKKNWDKAWPMMSERKGPVREGSPSIKLGLGIGAGSEGPSHVIKQGKPVFTPVQLHEFHLQALILKYMVAGLPVPLQLVLPIWKSVASSLGSVNGGIYNQYPTFVGFNPQGFDYRTMMDPEPGRCRRTDGKKWRCSWNVVPDQKYCERHMHRGRQRSRKHVEAFKPDASTTVNSSNKNTTINSNNTDSTNANLSISIPVNLQLATPSINTSNNDSITNTAISSHNGSNYNVDVNEGLTATPTIITTPTSNSESKNKVGVKNETAVATTTTIIRAGTGNDDNSRNNKNYVDIKDVFCNHINDNNNVHSSSNYGNNGNIGSTMTGFRFSPKSVLQVIGCSSPCLDYRSIIDPELHRCRRTDGKKWRCSSDVIPDQKYCGKHMHRGAKKLVIASQQVTVAAAAPSTSSTHLAPLAIPIKVDDSINLNTNLSISIPASPQPMTNDEKNSTSSSSDATTISDEVSSISHQLALSP